VVVIRLAAGPASLPGRHRLTASDGRSDAGPTPPPGAGITGPLTFLLVGVDTRVSSPGWEPHSDAVLLLRVERTLDRAYLFSLPRDLLVDIGLAEGRLSGGRTEAHPRDELRQQGSGGPSSPTPPRVRAAAYHGGRHTGADRAGASSPSAASTGWWTASAASTSTSTSGWSPDTGSRTAGTDQRSRRLRRPADGLSRVTAT
jgi:hypothetical protein